MSFSGEVKEELAKHVSTARHCRIAELGAIVSMCGHIQIDDENRPELQMQTENAAVSRKYFTLLKKTFNISTDVNIGRSLYLKKSRVYSLGTNSPEEAVKILQTLKMLDRDGEIVVNPGLISPVIIQNSCCKRAFIRGAFLASGSISDPEKFYHFEIVCQTMGKAIQLQNIICSFEIDAKIVQRKKSYVVYVKEGAQIVELLALMEANVALMNLENVRILKEMRNSVNRKVNCETANINKTVSAAVKQMEDIAYIDEHQGLDSLGDGLREVAMLRREYPEATLKELGQMLNPAIGKSGINHRLRKISELAETLRGGLL